MFIELISPSSETGFFYWRLVRMREETMYLSIGEVAETLGVNATTVYRLAQKGALPGFKVGSQWRFSGEQLESWIADQVTIEWLKAEDRAKSTKIQ